LICWHHGNIPAMARALGIKDAPTPWPEMQFDRVWRITLTDGSQFGGGEFATPFLDPGGRQAGTHTK